MYGLDVPPPVVHIPVSRAAAKERREVDLNRASISPIREDETQEQHAEQLGAEVAKFSKSKLENLRTLFDTFDADKSGEISKKEFVVVLRMSNFAPTKKELVKLFKKFDVDESGCINFEEYCHMVAEVEGIKRQGDMEAEKSSIRALSQVFGM